MERIMRRFWGKKRGLAITRQTGAGGAGEIER